MTLKNFSKTLAVLCTVAFMGSTSKAVVAPSDGGEGAKFQNKAFEMAEKSEFAVLLSFPAGKKVTATTDGEKQTDIHLFVYDASKKEIGKDTSPGPKCEVKFTPASQGKFKLVVRNLGPGSNKVTLAVKVAE